MKTIEKRFEKEKKKKKKISTTHPRRASVRIQHVIRAVDSDRFREMFDRFREIVVFERLVAQGFQRFRRHYFYIFSFSLSRSFVRSLRAKVFVCRLLEFCEEDLSNEKA
jgi:hypothetical protein